MEKQVKKSTKADRPRRGRPAGKNRVALSLEERRARNALYERERREETAQAMTELAEALGCDPNMVHGDLLATVISYIQNRPANDLDDLRSCNERLEAQIADCERRLAGEDSLPDLQPLKRKRTDDLVSFPDQTRPDKKYKPSYRDGYDAVVPQRTAEVPQPTPAQPCFSSAAGLADSTVDQLCLTLNSGFDSTNVDEVLQSFISTLEHDALSLDSVDLNSATSWSINEWIDEYL